VSGQNRGQFTGSARPPSESPGHHCEHFARGQQSLCFGSSPRLARPEAWPYEGIEFGREFAAVAPELARIGMLEKVGLAELGTRRMLTGSLRCRKHSMLLGGIRRRGNGRCLEYAARQSEIAIRRAVNIRTDGAIGSNRGLETTDSILYAWPCRFKSRTRNRLYLLLFAPDISTVVPCTHAHRPLTAGTPWH
jgi:hypothetical protein